MIIHFTGSWLPVWTNVGFKEPKTTFGTNTESRISDILNESGVFKFSTTMICI